jgi:hypothetical protein
MGEYVRMRDSGDGGRVPDTSNMGQVQTKTANYTIKAYESGGFIFSNRGAAGPVVFTLPPPANGERLIFIKEVPAQQIQLNVPASPINVTIRGGVTPFTGTSLISSGTTEFSSIELLAAGNSWYIVRQSATWTIS